MKRIILSAVVAAAAIFGAYTANQTSELASMGLLDATGVEAEAYPGEVLSSSKYQWHAIARAIRNRNNNFLIFHG